MSLDTIIDTLSWYETWQLSGCKSYPCKTKTSQETQKSLQKFLEPTRKTGVIYTDNSWEFGKQCEDISLSHSTWTLHRSEIMGLLREQCAELRKDICGTVAIRSGWKMVGGFPWNVIAICETFKISCLMGRHPLEGGSECHSTVQLSRLEQLSNITLFLRETCRDCINLVLKSCQENSVDVRCTRGESGKETFWSQTLRNWNRWTHQKSSEKTQCKGSVHANERWQILFSPLADGAVKISGGDQDLRTFTWIRDSPDRGEEQHNLQGESDGSSSTPRQDSSWYDGDARHDFWFISGDFIYRHHVEPRVKLYVPREESFLIPLKYIDVTRTTDTSLDVLLAKQKDNWNVDGDRKLPDARTGFTRFIVLNDEPPDGYTLSGRRLTRKQTTSRPDNVWPDLWKHMSDASKRKENQKWAIEKPKLENVRRLRVFSSLSLMMRKSSL